MQEEDDDSGTVVQGSWVRMHGYITECDIDARWVLYYPNDPKPQGSLRIVSHPDLPPGHLRSFVSIVTKRWPKTSAELAKTLENYGIVTEDELFFHNGYFYKSKVDNTYYVYNNTFYRTKTYDRNGDKIIVNYADPINQNEILKPNTINKTETFADEFRVTTYSNQLSKAEFENMFRSVINELDAYNIFENVQTWDTETMDKMRNLEKLYNVKIFE